MSTREKNNKKKVYLPNIFHFDNEAISLLFESNKYLGKCSTDYEIVHFTRYELNGLNVAVIEYKDEAAAQAVLKKKQILFKEKQFTPTVYDAKIRKLLSESAIEQKGDDNDSDCMIISDDDEKKSIIVIKKEPIKNEPKEFKVKEEMSIKTETGDVKTEATHVKSEPGHVKLEFSELNLKQELKDQTGATMCLKSEETGEHKITHTIKSWLYPWYLLKLGYYENTLNKLKEYLETNCDAVLSFDNEDFVITFIITESAYRTMIDTEDTELYDNMVARLNVNLKKFWDGNFRQFRYNIKDDDAWHLMFREAREYFERQDYTKYGLLLNETDDTKFIRIDGEVNIVNEEERRIKALINKQNK